MKKSFKWILYILLSIGVLLVVATFTINYLVKDQIENYIREDLPQNIAGSYNELSVGILNGSILLTDPIITIQNEEDSLKHTFIHGKELRISGLSYWRYFFKKEIHIGKIILEDLE